MNDIGAKIIGGFASIIALAIIAVIFSTRSNAQGVIGTTLGGLANLIGVATAPITGQSVGGLSTGLTGPTAAGWTTPVLNYAGQSGTFGSAYGGGGSLGIQTPQFGLNLSGAGSLINSVGNLFGSTGGGGGGGLFSGGGSGFVDSGTWDLGGSGPSQGYITG